MALTKLAASLANVQGLPDRPNESGYTAAQLKQVFDKAGEEQIKAFLNTVLTAELDTIIESILQSIAGHTGNKANPHTVTAVQVGLGQVNNTSDAAKPVSTAQAAAIALKADKVAGAGVGHVVIFTASGNLTDSGLTPAEVSEGAILTMTVAAVPLAEGVSPTVEKTKVDGKVHLIFGIPAGAQGPQGDPSETFIDQNTGAAIYEWYGTVAEYNALAAVHPNWRYNILEEVPS
jgi:hypothetical protein